MKKVILMGSVLVVLLTACDKDDDDNDTLNSTDQMFITQVAIGNTAEVQAGQLAATKGTSAGVKAFGQMMVTEHSQAQTELKNIGTTAGMNVKDSVDPAHQLLVQRLSTLTGKSFDTAYINSQVVDHQNTLNIFQTEISSGNNQNVKSYAGKYLPNIQLHYNKADSIRKAL